MYRKNNTKKGANRLIGITLVILFSTLIILLAHRNVITSKQIKEIEDEIIDKSNRKKVEVWVIKGGLADVVGEVLERYIREYPEIKFSIKEFEESVYNKAILEAAATNSLPEIFYTWGDKELEDYVKLGMVKDITILVKGRKLPDIMVDGALDGYTIHNRIYGIPVFGWNTVLYCNKDIFEKLEIEYPTSYEQFLNTIVEFKINDVTPIAISQQDIWMASLYYMSLALAEGDVSTNIDACNNVEEFSSIEFMEAAKSFEELAKLRPWNDNYQDASSEESVKFFTNGKSAMLLSGSWVSSLIDEGYTIVKPNSVEVIKFPSSNTKDEGVAGYSDGFAISNDDNLDEKINELICIQIIKDISDVAVLDRGLGIPVYKNQDLDSVNLSTLKKCQNIFPKEGYHSAFDKLLEKEYKEIYNDALMELMMGVINYKEFIVRISQGN